MAVMNVPDKGSIAVFSVLDMAVSVKQYVIMVLIVIFVFTGNYALSMFVSYLKIFR